jgi:hypothetical protein
MLHRLLILLHRGIKGVGQLPREETRDAQKVSWHDLDDYIRSHEQCFEFVVGESAAKRTLTWRDAQHEYVFNETEYGEATRGLVDRLRRCVDSIPIPRNSKSEGNKYDVHALDALEIPRLGIELHFGWGLSNLSPKLPRNF